MFVSYSVRCWQSPLPFEKGGIIVKRKLAAALLAVLVMASMATAYARVEWGYWVDGPDGFYLEDPANHANDGWGNGELGDESIPLYALCGLALAAAAGAVVMHRKRQRVG